MHRAEPALHIAGFLDHMLASALDSDYRGNAVEHAIADDREQGFPNGEHHMDLETFNWLLTGAGLALLGEAMACDLGDAAQLRELTRLRRQATPERAAAAYEIAVLRRRAAAKFGAAELLYFTREALEQASGERIAGYRAQRYQAYGTVADLCCGTGGDTLALAGVANVIAV